MTTIWHSFLWLLARAADRELAKMVQFLKVENQILRGKLPRRITVTSPERRRLVKFGRALGSALQTLLTIVSPRTFLRWVNGETEAARKRKAGRRRTDQDIRDLVLKIARETGFGHTRILGELRKLGVHRVSRSTVINILKAGGFDPGPKRGEGTWSDFLTRHAASLWACDFFTKKVVTACGMVDYFVLFFIHVGSRRVHVAGISANPDARWMAQTARNVLMFLAEQPVKPKYLIRDLDGKFSPQFDGILESDGIAVMPVGPCAPNLNAYAERWVQSVKHECLDHFVIFGENHLRYLIDQYVEHYHLERPHQSLGNAPLTGVAPPESASFGKVVCDQRLGGLLKHYRRAA